MAPKFKVSREEILEAAYALLRDSGSDAVTTRAIGEKLGVSCRPIYSFFPSMETLRADLVVTCMQALHEYTHRQFTKNSFLNQGVGYIWFYRELPNVADFLERNCSASMLESVESQLFEEFLAVSKGNPELAGITHEEFEGVYTKLSVFTSGLVMYVRMNWVEFSLEDVIELLKSTGEALFMQLLSKKENTAIGPGQRACGPKEEI